jgi:hypothetical protein
MKIANVILLSTKKHMGQCQMHPGRKRWLVTGPFFIFGTCEKDRKINSRTDQIRSVSTDFDFHEIHHSHVTFWASARVGKICGWGGGLNWVLCSVEG